jgi:hypothetical protein
MEDVSQGSGGFVGQGATLLKGNLIYSPVASIMTTLPWQGTNYCGRDGLGDFPGRLHFQTKAKSLLKFGHLTKVPSAFTSVPVLRQPE